MERTKEIGIASAVIERAATGMGGGTGAGVKKVAGATGKLALLAVRLTRVLVQSSREVALLVSNGPLLLSAKG